MRWSVPACCLLFMAFAVTGRCQTTPEAAVVSIFSCDAKGTASHHATGFFVSTDGKIASTRHAIENTARAIVQTNDGRQHEVLGIIADDPLHDLVLLQIKGSGFQFLTLGAFDQIYKDAAVRTLIDAYTLREGATGKTPLHAEGRTIKGTIASVNNLADDYQWLSINMPVRKGESGSPVLNEAGEVIGMNRGRFGDRNLSLAVSVDYIKHLLAGPLDTYAPRPVAQMKKREFEELFDDVDFKAGLHASAREDYKEAARHMELAVKHFPQSGAFHVLLGNCYGWLSRWSDAKDEFEKAIAIKPGNAIAWASLGVALAYQGKSDEAARACEKAAKLKSDVPETWINIAGVYMMLKRDDEAQAIVNRMLERKKTEPDETTGRLVLPWK